jgi:hypothetical protein
MEASACAECIVTINAYHREHLRPLVVCSRTNEYETAAAREQLRMLAAVVVQPLLPEQVDAHLATIGKPLVALRGAYQSISNSLVKVHYRHIKTASKCIGV